MGKSAVGQIIRHLNNSLPWSSIAVRAPSIIGWAS